MVTLTSKEIKLVLNWYNTYSVYNKGIDDKDEALASFLTELSSDYVDTTLQNEKEEN